MVVTFLFSNERENDMDYIVRGTAANGQIRCFAAYTKDMVEMARTSHDTSPTATAALGRLLTAGAMMGVMMKGDKNLLTLQIKSGGPIDGITVTADSKGTVKGYVGNPKIMVPASDKGKLDVGAVVGVGFLNVIMDLGMKEPYVSQTMLQTSEIAEDLTYYFATSQQTPSTVGLGVLMNKDNTVKQAGGFVIQLMPFASEETISKLEANLQDVKSVTDLFEEGLSPEGFLERLLDGLDLVINNTMSTQFKCNCDKQRVAKALISVGKKELQTMIDDGEEIELNCHFCNSSYQFSVAEIKELLKLSR